MFLYTARYDDLDKLYIVLPTLTWCVLCNATNVMNNLNGNLLKAGMAKLSAFYKFDMQDI
jgi:hypothetical protein